MGGEVQCHQALLLRKALNDAAGEADTLTDLGIFWNALGESQKALDFSQQAHSLWLVVGNRREEANEIIKLVPEADRKVVVDFAANRATATDEALSRYRYVHFATHGILNNSHPELSGLVLSLVDQQGKSQDGFLQLTDIYNLKLPAELVVLSACQTALGKEIKGEGLVGLTRGFMYAGAPRVVASLWSVSDASTAELMRGFYQGMLRDKQRPAAALRAAQLALWKKNPQRNPYFWAGFVLQGEWK